jgi:hypothetical protein
MFSYYSMFAAAAAAPPQMAERLVSGLPLRCDSVESQKVNEFLVKRLEVRVDQRLTRGSPEFDQAASR